MVLNGKNLFIRVPPLKIWHMSMRSVCVFCVNESCTSKPRNSSTTIAKKEKKIELEQIENVHFETSNSFSCLWILPRHWMETMNFSWCTEKGNESLTLIQYMHTWEVEEDEKKTIRKNGVCNEMEYTHSMIVVSWVLPQQLHQQQLFHTN